MTTWRNFSAICLGMWLGIGSAAAHLPIFSDGSAFGPETAIVIDDVAISRVVYHEVTECTRELWIKFSVQADQQVTFQLGIPQIDRLKDFRPALAIVGPGSPAIDLPFEIPAGFGGVVLSAPEGAELAEFHEEFTGTDSWIVGDLTIVFPQAGEYYAVAYVPDRQLGKLWVAFGEEEVFGLDQIASFGEVVNQVREFHEIPPVPIPCFGPLLGAVLLSAGVIRLLRARQRNG